MTFQILFLFVFHFVYIFRAHQYPAYFEDEKDTYIKIRIYSPRSIS
ncbi:hypothetical protein NG271_002 [Saccharomyces cerevisiae synthetic construct]|uniref:Putative uncharacterized protein YDL240C-A n=2 Tax=Saccharomyces cerevisiae TaxID=4932 RepID=YD240_YEAST|nr:RecName: Full=Putative uncharacterized protein YDL240C-A; Flags: Precursor [Saccharomyces cerevisiae S288C]EWG86858.1 hypothetical protein R008_D10041 [Saccharomyces cerevisiae R008]EWG91581.1 hypothetical protein P301_D10046 [Saccharomyces cerevisiae P301]EWG96776.1 hypothetical protein R103_D20016 [Saccharomyces cerevisiae R103]KZV11977.1 hypothetical protein WN66_00790 [Saccharomyces cerevisiae]WNF19561.1 hypothetical protein NG271_002 [Saccharomyces cerevisiae synthetic construct]CAY79